MTVAYTTSRGVNVAGPFPALGDLNSCAAGDVGYALVLSSRPELGFLRPADPVGGAW
jgi:hypothetical protein